MENARGLGGTSSRCTTQITKGFEIEFHALLTDGRQEVRFERMAVG